MLALNSHVTPNNEIILTTLRPDDGGWGVYQIRKKAKYRVILFYPRRSALPRFIARRAGEKAREKQHSNRVLARIACAQDAVFLRDGQLKFAL